MTGNMDRNDLELLAALRALFAATPWMVIALMFILEPEQWEALLSGRAMEGLRKSVKQLSLPALDAYQLSHSDYADDLTQEVLIKLAQGRFLKRYSPARKHPRAYLLGSAFQYARTLARSFWRSAGRNRRLDDWG